MDSTTQLLFPTCDYRRRIVQLFGNVGEVQVRFFEALEAAGRMISETHFVALSLFSLSQPKSEKAFVVCFVAIVFVCVHTYNST